MKRWLLVCVFSVCWLAFVSWGFCESVDRIIILKSKRVMLLMKGPEIIRAYRVALGWNPKGHKFMEGDGRTPEGVYQVEAKNTKSHYYKSLKISYPNERDLLEAQRMKVKPGGMIMIHGLPKNMLALGKRHRNQDWTQGCIALTNQEIDEVWNLVEEGTTVEIYP